MSHDPAIDTVIPASVRRLEKEAYGFAAGVSLWTFLVIEHYFSLWAGGSTVRFALTFLYVPVVCFVVLVGITMAALCLAVLPSRWLKFGRAQYDRLACVMLLSFFGLASLVLLGDLEPTAHFLGWVWWAGLAFCLLIHAFGRSMAEEPDGSLQLKPEN
ncbi:hypothetical protein [Verrucomicrobium spinosum]|uniref:hypothetical protein n=1 Tax=Verrucomicrobium spinosum TaxID=2736 RepID=UPI000174533F|nr:hypothetical protein [Verrucomicrobium spinosum]